MANNRMSIVCKRCQVGMGIAKYYPHDNWYFSTHLERLEKFIKEHASRCFFRESVDDWMGGGAPFYLGYEWDHRGWNHGVEVKEGDPIPLPQGD